MRTVVTENKINGGLGPRVGERWGGTRQGGMHRNQSEVLEIMDTFTILTMDVHVTKLIKFYI